MLHYMMPENITIFLTDVLEGQRKSLQKRLEAEISGLRFQHLVGSDLNPEGLMILLKPGTHDTVRPEVGRVLHKFVRELEVSAEHSFG